MVLINGVKYACERCIRGHRVTTCNHTDQPLMMIKPKGRPSTTCDHCKELRKNKNANPSGMCTCGRLEKKRLAQKAKEEARAKAKEEKKLHECRCGSDEPCKCHSNRRSRTSHTRKLKNTNVGGSRPSSQHLDSASIGGMGHVMSPVSMDSNSSIQNGSASTSNINISGIGKAEPSSLFPSGFLDTGEFNGKISKDYHQVPSLASISSLHSGQSPSFDQKLGLPQSPLLNGLSRNSGGNFFNWADDVGSLYPAKSDSGVNLLENDKPNSNVSGNTNTSSMNNFPGDLGVGIYFGVNNGSTNGNENGNGDGNDNVNGSKSMNTNLKMKNPNAKVPFDEYGVPPEINTNQSNDPSGNNMSAPLNDWNTDKSPDVGNMTNFAQNNGLLDIFMDSTTVAALSKDSLMGQQDNFDFLNENNRTQGKINSNINPSYSHNGTNNHNDINKTNGNFINNGNANHNQYRNRIWASPFGTDRSDTVSVDGESMRSVEGASLAPSFMDTPERASSLHSAHSVLYQQPHPHNQAQKQIKRTTSANRGYRSQPSGRPAVPITINPSMVSSIDDTISVTSLQSPASSLIDNNGFSTSLGNSGDFGTSNPLFERSKSPQLGLEELTNTTIPTTPQFSKQRSNVIPSTNSKFELDRLLGLDTGNTSGLPDNSAISESNNNDNLVFQNDTATLSSPADKGVFEEASLMNGNQTTSPPSQLFTEKGFADLDNFMSTL
ncbi:hypothetical protein ZYGR_0S01070 [Zygosaccharomyces rouxii]|uniref:Copper-fist domain-containing protein n=1 Tax=Zygosaccharomyces rouxii TaxID=4956 RepID=A0A1Q3A2M7_ZYGRO|nr:hypothetical protein ZYGR_0S01070 [Zygosaccharomyces rouxii]